MSDATPHSFGRYELLELISVGGSAEVWRARVRGREETSQDLIVKKLYPHLSQEREAVASFQSEALIAGPLSHPSIVRILEFGDVLGNHYIAREYVPGASLSALAHKAGSWMGGLTSTLAVWLVASVCESLHYVHSRRDSRDRLLGLVHRSVSPAHILMGLDGMPRLIGFGGYVIGQTVPAPLQRERAMYMAPEQLAGATPDTRSDVFCLGLVLYELLTDVHPFRRDSEVETFRALVDCEIRPPLEVARVTRRMERVMMKALARDPSDRYADAFQLQSALRENVLPERWGECQELLAMLMGRHFPRPPQEDG